MEQAFERYLAHALMDIGAVLLRPETPFLWASGWHSPIYCDNRRILSHPGLRTRVADEMARLAREKYPDVEVIAGVATGAIALGVLVAERLDKPFIYVRPKPKDHGTGAQIEGEDPAGRKVVVIEDLVSTGASSLVSTRALANAGAQVLGMLAIFSYNFNLSRRAFESDNVELTTLSDYDTLVEVARETGYIRPEEEEVLKEWRFSPSTWGKTEEA